MTQPDPIVLNVDPSNFVAGLSQAQQATGGFVTSLRGVPLAVGPMQRSLDAITPKRATLLGFSALAAGAADTQQQLVGVHVQSKLVGTDFNQMSGGIRTLAKELPIGNAGARAMYSTLTQLGVAGTGVVKPLNSVDTAVNTLQKSALRFVPGMTKMSTSVENLFGNRGKMTDPGTERRVAALATTFAKLGGATGEDPNGLATGMIQLNRVMGTGLKTDRVEKFADSVTTLSVQTGASASGILSFSHAIAPMARAAGIGELGVLGISTAFNRMGEDGTGAATAVNKIMGDMSRSLREGSPQLEIYAQIVGKTRKEFTDLAKNNPAEALTQVTEALGKDPQNAPRKLESLGMDGVRTQRYLQELSQTGQLRSSIATANSSYGNGSTEAASKDAFGGLADSTQRAAAASKDLADSLGTPLLGPLTLVSDALGMMASGIGKVTGSHASQGLLGMAAWAGGLALVGAKLVGPGLRAAGFGQLATSGPVRGLLGGFAMARAGQDPAQAAASRAGRLGGAQYISRQQAGLPVGTGFMSRVNQGFERVGQGLGGASVASGGPGGGYSALRLAGAAPGLAVGSLLRTQAEQMRLARTNFSERSMTMKPYGAETQKAVVDRKAARDAYSGEQSRIKAAAGEGKVSLTRGGFAAEETIARKQMVAQLKVVNAEYMKSLATGSGAVGGFARQVAMGTASLARQSLATGGTAVIRGGAAIGGKVASAFGGPVGVGLMVGMAGYSAYSKNKANAAAEADRERTGTGMLDNYRAAMGDSAVQTIPIAQRQAADATSIAKNTSSMEQALTIGSEAKRAAALTTTPAYKFTGSASSAGALLRMEQHTSGFTPSDVARIRADLIKQYNTDGAATALSGLSTSTARDPLTSGDTSDIADTVTGVGQAKEKGGILSAIKRRALDGNRGWKTGLGARGSQHDYNLLTDESKDAITAVSKNIQARQGERQKYGVGYAQQEARKEMDAAIAAAQGTNSNSVLQQTAKSFMTDNGMTAHDVNWDDLKKAGSFSAYMQTKEGAGGEGWKSRVGSSTDAKVDPGREPSIMESRLAGTDNKLKGWFGPEKSAASDAIAASAASPETASVQNASLTTLMDEAKKAGTSLVDLAISSVKAADANGNASDATHALMMSLNAAAHQAMAANAPFQSDAANAMDAAKVAAGEAQLVGNDPETQAKRAGGKTDLTQIQNDASAAAKARLTAQREYEVGSARQAEDFATSTKYNTTDHDRQMGRQADDVALQNKRAGEDNDKARDRAQRDYDKARTRGEEDFHLSMFRGERDFNISISQSNEDFNKARLRAVRDFNISMKRQIEDSANTLFDPYKRIATQPVWDTQTLISNMKEQNDQVRAQLANLQSARSSGLSDSVISMLGLNDPNNAQQLATMVGALANDPALAAALNASAGTRKTLAEQLLGDPSNLNVQRQKEDLAKGLADMAKDFETNQERSWSGFKRGQADAYADFGKNQLRQSADFQSQMDRMAQDYDTAVKRMAESTSLAVQRANEDFGIAVARAQTSYDLLVKRAGEDLARADQIITGTLAQLTEALNKTLTGQFGAYQNLTQNGMKGWLGVLQAYAGQWHDIVNGLSTGINVDMTTTTKPGGGANTTSFGNKRYAEGTIVQAPGSGHHAILGEQGPELVLPLDQRGARYLLDVLNRLGPGPRPQSSALEARAVADATSRVGLHGADTDRRTAAAASTVVYDQSVHHTYSGVTIEHVEMAATDPMDFVRQAQAIASRANLTPSKPSGARSA